MSEPDDQDRIVEQTLLHREHTVVLLARHRRTRRHLVLKEATDERGAAELHRGAAALLAADHPAVLAVLDLDDDVLVLPHVAGGTVAELVRTSGPLEERPTAHLLLGICDALDHLHRRSVVHGDLSASNVLLHPDGHPVLADPAPPDGRGHSAGTAGYAPPEAAGAPPTAGAMTGVTTDLYALGVLGLECLGPTGAARLRTVLVRAAHPDPTRRFTTSRALAIAIDKAVPGTTWLDRVAPQTEITRGQQVDEPATRAFGPLPPRPQPEPPRTRGRTVGRVLVALAALAALLIAVGVTVAAVRAEPSGACPPTGGDRAGQVVGDLDGDGCDESVAWDAAAAVATLPGGRQVQVGEADDQLVLGDWDCDRSDTPALYRPSTGEVFEFGAWVTGADAVTSSRTHETGIRDGSARVAQPTGAGCDHVAVAR